MMRDVVSVAIAEALPDACWLHTPHDGRFTYVNPAFVRRWGGRVDDPCASAQCWLHRVHRDDRDAVRAALDGLAHGQAYAIEYRAHDDGGATLWIAEHTCFVRTPDGQPRQVFGIARDITLSKRSERELQLAIRRKDEFLAILMHEMRTPLQAILAASQVQAGLHSAPARIIARQVQHLVRLVDDLAESTRVTQRKVHLQLETVDLRDVVQGAIDALHSLFDDRQLQVRLMAPAQGVWVHADPARLAQVFNNLLHNAAKFSPLGGRVDVALSRAPWSRQATVSVRDHGIGIPPESLASVFDLFVQADGRPGALRGGLGIGLSVVRSLVELHGGQVSVHSEGRGTGSRFDVTLATVAAPGRSAPRRILIVEDNVDAAAGLQQLLQREGHTVIVAHDGRSALEQVAGWRPDTVILDLELPDLDGREVARRIAAASNGNCPQLIALSGSGEPQADPVFQHCLSKPAPLSELEAAISAWTPREATLQ